MLLTLGAAAGSLVPLQATIRQERSPARLLPRVVGLSTASIPVAAPLGALATGFLIDGIGLHRSMLLTTAARAADRRRRAAEQGDPSLRLPLLAWGRACPFTQHTFLQAQPYDARAGRGAAW